MALPSVASSSNRRRAKAFAVRSFPPLCGPAAAAAAAVSDELPAPSGNLISDQKAPPTPLIASLPEPSSCAPGSDFLSYRGKIFKPPIAFAHRIFPKGCGPKPSDEASIDTARRVSEEGNAEKSDRKSSQMLDSVEGGGRLGRAEAYEGKIEAEGMEEKLDDLVRRISESVKDGEKPNRKSSLKPDFVKDGKRLCRPEGLNDVAGREEGLNDVARRSSKEGSGLGKILKDVAVVGKSLGGKDGEKPDRKSSVMPYVVKDGRRFYRTERPEHKSKVEGMEAKVNNVLRRIYKEGNGLGKISKTDVVGSSLGEKDGKKDNRKRALVTDVAENGTSEGSQLLEVRGDRLIVLALMAAKRCPWMQGKGRGSIGLQSGQKKPRSRARGNSNKS